MAAFLGMKKARNKLSVAAGVLAFLMIFLSYCSGGGGRRLWRGRSGADLHYIRRDHVRQRGISRRCHDVERGRLRHCHDRCKWKLRLQRPRERKLHHNAREDRFYVYAAEQHADNQRRRPHWRRFHSHRPCSISPGSGLPRERYNRRVGAIPGFQSNSDHRIVKYDREVDKPGLLWPHRDERYSRNF